MSYIPDIGVVVMVRSFNISVITGHSSNQIVYMDIYGLPVSVESGRPMHEARHCVAQSRRNT